MRPAEAFDRATAELARAGCPAARHDARLLLADVLADAAPDAPDGALSAAAVDAFMAAVNQRAARRPLAYVRSRTSFRGLDMAVDPRVFVPRAETELLVEAALTIPLRSRVLEPCTGSGAVAIALTLERPDLAVTASDVSPEALGVARHNAARLGAPVRIVHADGIAAVPGGPFEAIVCNPPYVAERQRGAGTLPPELEQHEPGGAFWAGADGLRMYERLIRELAEPIRWVAFEIGDDQEDAVAHLLSCGGFALSDRLRAPSGAVRVLVASR
ncbi:MAG TPA: HemK/PrmC family methyltransferase [Solirubrobacteraceae bacterium]|jgi:release factor glutamine methyltransferase|nr:HemK/PrmC family methyltransferase [Solirubrobacteraceae bacterium]